MSGEGLQFKLESNVIFRSVIVMMFAAIMGLSAYIANNMLDGYAAEKDRVNSALDVERERITRANMRLYRLCERLAIIEFKLEMRYESCGQLQ